VSAALSRQNNDNRESRSTDYVPFASRYCVSLQTTMKTFARREASRLLSRSNASFNTHIPTSRQANICIRGQRRAFHGSRRLLVVKPYLLADIGEGKNFIWSPPNPHEANVIARYHRMSSHTMVREARRARRTIRPDMRGTI
jgi:hypothetical protein